jgi:hypothetical protein
VALADVGDSWLPHQAGIAVYERARSGLRAAVRLYDDIERSPTACRRVAESSTVVRTLALSEEHA